MFAIDIWNLLSYFYKFLNPIGLPILFKFRLYFEFCYQLLKLMKSELDQILDLSMKEKSYYEPTPRSYTNGFMVLKVSRATNQCKWSFILT